MTLGALLASLVTVTPLAVGVPSGAVSARPTAQSESGDPESASWLTAVAGHRSWVHDGAATLFTGPDWQFHVTGSLETGVNVRAYQPDGYALDFSFQAPWGEVLTEGTYTNTAQSNAHTPRPGLEVSSSGRACNEANGGSFVVHDIDPSLSRLWITYEYSCGPITGELRLNEPAGAVYDVAPTRVTWPAEPAGQLGRLVPVTLLNTSAGPIAVKGVAVTQGAEDFSVAHDTCGRVPAGGYCHAHVRFRPEQPGHRTGVLTFETDRGAREIPLDGRGNAAVGPPIPVPRRVHAEQNRTAPRYTQWHMEADRDAWVGNPDGSHRFGAGDIRYVRGIDSKFEIRARTESDFFQAYFRADDDHLLLPGTTVTPVRSDYPDGPYDTGKVLVDGNHRGCGGRTDATYTVHEATYDKTGRLTGIALTFRYACVNGDQNGEVRGVIAWNATTVPRLPGEPARRATHVGLRADRRANGSVRLSGRLRPGGAGRTLMIERRAPGTHDWRLVRRVETGTGGKFARTLRNPLRGSYHIRFRGTPRLAPATSRAIWISPERRGL